MLDILEIRSERLLQIKRMLRSERSYVDVVKEDMTLANVGGEERMERREEERVRWTVVTPE